MMSRRGIIPIAAGLCILLFQPAFIAAAEQTTAISLSQPSEPINGAVLDLEYPVQDLTGASLQSGSKSDKVAGGSEALSGGVVDLQAAGAQIQESSSEIKISLQGEILFDFDKSNIRAAAEPALTEVAVMIRKNRKPNVLIEGYTDGKGSQSYNLKLSERRAASVKTWLAAHGIPDSGIRTKGFGAAKPVAPNTHQDGSDDPEGRQKNRRVEITIKK
jgi:outer membrane protein OmpA-like peptidoglycan-associated protein